jgi:hypothetical protein
MPTREPPPIWPDESPDADGGMCTNNMPASELRRGDKFLVCGYGEIPGQATVEIVVEGQNHPDLPKRDYMIALVKIPKNHVFDYVERVSQ